MSAAGMTELLILSLSWLHAAYPWDELRLFVWTLSSAHRRRARETDNEGKPSQHQE